MHHHYYFDIHDDESLVVDEFGLCFVDEEAALLAAIKALPEMARDKALNSRYNLTVVVRNESGVVVSRAALSLEVDRREPLT